MSARVEGIGARVLRLDGLAARPLPLPQPPNASHPRRRPREVQGAGDTDDGVAGAARGGTRHLVGPVILPPTTLIIAVAVLLVTPARGGVFTIRRALHATPCTGPKALEDLDGEKATLHQLKMESEPIRQAVVVSEGLPPSVEIHDVRGGELDVGPCAAVPATPHMQLQRLRRIQLHLPRKWSREAKAMARWLAQPDEEFAGVVPSVALHRRKGCWRGRGGFAAPSSSPQGSTVASASTPSPSSSGRLRRYEFLGRSDALSGRNPRRH